MSYDDDDWTDEELRASLARSFSANGWDEPAMDGYDAFWQMIEKRCQENRIPWEEAKKQLGL